MWVAERAQQLPESHLQVADVKSVKLQKSVKLSALVASTFKETTQKNNNVEENTLIYIHMIIISFVLL